METCIAQSIIWHVFEGNGQTHGIYPSSDVDGTQLSTFDIENRKISGKDFSGVTRSINDLPIRDFLMDAWEAERVPDLWLFEYEHIINPKAHYLRFKPCVQSEVYCNARTTDWL